MINIMYLMDDLMIGGNTSIINILKYLDKSKYKLTVCCLYGGGPLKQELDLLKIEVKILNFHHRKFSSLAEFIKLLKSNKTYLLHSYCFVPNTISRIVGLLARVPVVVYSECALVDKRSGIRHFLDWLLSHFSKRIIAVSEAVKKSIISSEKIPASKISVIYNGVDLDKFNLNFIPQSRLSANLYNNWPIIGMIANFRWEKAHHIFIKSAKIVLKEFPNAKFLLVGDSLGEKGKKTRLDAEELAKSLNLSENIIFMGPRYDIAEILSRLTVKVLSSVSEGLGLSLLEAMALSKPVVAASSGGIPEVVVDKVTGLLVPPNDAVALAEAILEILHDKELASRMGREGRKRVEEMFDARGVVKELEAIYDRF